MKYIWVLFCFFGVHFIEANQNCIEQVVDKQLIAYNEKDYEVFASCYDENIESYDLETSTLIAQMSGLNFFIHYRDKFNENPNIQCKVINRMVHDDLVIDHEYISSFRGNNHVELVIYQVTGARITKMWFTREILKGLDL